MEILKFNINGLAAAFKKPYTNKGVELSYSHIHKIALLGILGGIIGIDKTSNKFNFYEQLKDLKVSIVPKEEVFSTQNEPFTETVGFSNRENGKVGSNYLSKYEILINPSWDIYIMDSNNKNYKKIKDFILNNKAYFIPYLGKNHFFANIENMEVLEGEETKEYSNIDSLFLPFGNILEDDFGNEKELIEIDNELENPLLFSEEDNNIIFKQCLPIGFDNDLMGEGQNQYIETKFIFTNKTVRGKKTLIKCENKILYFF